MNRFTDEDLMFCDAPFSSVVNYMQRRDELYSEQLLNVIDLKLLEAENPIINLTDLVDERMAKKVRDGLRLLQMKGSPALQVNITSDGGFVRAGMGIHDQLLMYGPNTLGVACEYVSSAAIQLILQGCILRYATANTEFFCHYAQGYMPINGRILRKDSQRAIQLKHFEAIDNKMVRILIDRTGRTEKEIRKMLFREQVMDADEALEFGLIDKIVPLSVIKGKKKAQQV